MKHIRRSTDQEPRRMAMLSERRPSLHASVIGVGLLLGLVSMLGCGPLPGDMTSTGPGLASPPAWTPDPTFQTDGVHYESTRGGDSDKLDSEWLDMMRRAAPGSEPDARLHRLAELVSQHYAAHGETPNSAYNAWLAMHVAFPLTNVFVIAFDRSANTSAAGSLPQIVAQRHREAQSLHKPYTRFGVGVTEQSGRQKGAIVLMPSLVDFDPIPRQPRGPVRIRGQVKPPYTEAQVIVAQPDGRVRRGEASDGARFDTLLEPNMAGEYRIEVVGRGPQGNKVLANFPVYVGVPLPAAPDAQRIQGSWEPASFETELVRLINRSRAEAGLPPVQRWARLDTVARGHSEDMARNAFLGHNSDATGTAHDRVARAGIRRIWMGENIARNSSPQQMHEGLMRSPGHRGSILNPQATKVGLAVVPHPTSTTSAPSFLMTQIFIRPR